MISDDKIISVYKEYGYHDEQFNKSFNRGRKDYVERVLSMKSYISQLSDIKQNNISSDTGNSVNGSAQNNGQQAQNFRLEQSQIHLAKMQSADNFEFYKKLGRGAFGDVYLVKMKNLKDHKYYAMKVIDKDKIKEGKLVRFAKIEKDVMYMMDHPFIVRLKYAFQTDYKLFLVMQYCPGGDLSQLLDDYEKLPEDLARLYLAEILLALESLH